MATVTRTSPQVERIQPLENGDRLTAAEFERRYHAMPSNARAELVEGVVYVSSPVSRKHGKPHFDLSGWLGLYRALTPGLEGLTDSTVRSVPTTWFNPISSSASRSEHGGHSQDSEDDYVAGAPELVIEIAVSTASYDLHDKLDAYRRNQVLEYMVWMVGDAAIDWFALQEGRYEKLEPSADGILRSVVFPGLWLDRAAILKGDMAAVLRVVQEGVAGPEHAAFVAELEREANRTGNAPEPGGPTALSDDEILFEDMTYREPHKLKRLDLDRRVVSIPYQVPAPDDLLVFLDRKPADLIERHSLRDTSVELGGILLGKECLDEETGRTFVWVTEALEAKHYENTQASFTYTHDSWEEITRERDAKHPDLDIVGWYHTHPDFGIFLSGHDLFIHHNFFAQPLQVAYVVDPIRQTRGFFQWRDNQMVQVGGFYLTAARNERAQVARLVNELEGIPNADGGGGGGGLSPRLEAELFAMLSRPQTVAMAGDRGQTAAVFTLIGMLLAGLIFAGAFWLQALGRGMNDQAKALDDLVKAQKEATTITAKAIDSERSAAKADALEVILKEVKADPAAASTRVVARLTEAIAERDLARKEANRLRIEKEAVSDRAAADEERARSAQGKAEEARKELANLEKESRSTEERLSTDLGSLKVQFEDASKLLKDSSTGELVRRYNWSFYLAVVGWAGFLGCGVALATAYARHVAQTEETLHEPPRHTIT